MALGYYLSIKESLDDAEQLLEMGQDFVKLKDVVWMKELNKWAEEPNAVLRVDVKIRKKCAECIRTVKSDKQMNCWSYILF